MNMRVIRDDVLRTGAVLAILLAVTGVCRAIPVTVVLTDGAVIHDPEREGRVRILLRFEMPDELEHGVVDMATAYLEFMTSQQGAAPVAVEAHAMTRSWDPETVVWDAVWASGEGSWDESRMSGGRIRFGATPALAMDVSELLCASARSRAVAFDVVLLAECDAFLMPADVRVTGGTIHLDYSIVD